MNLELRVRQLMDINCFGDTDDKVRAIVADYRKLIEQCARTAVVAFNDLYDKRALGAGARSPQDFVKHAILALAEPEKPQGIRYEIVFYD